MEKFLDNEKLNTSFFISEIKGIIISIFFTLFLFIILGLCLANTNLSEVIIKPAIIIISGISILAGSSISIRKQEKGGIIKGLIVGFLYTFILYIISSILMKNFSLNIYSVLMFIVSSICGAVGGIIGVNLK